MDWNMFWTTATAAFFGSLVTLISSYIVFNMQKNHLEKSEFNAKKKEKADELLNIIMDVSEGIMTLDMKSHNFKKMFRKSFMGNLHDLQKNNYNIQRLKNIDEYRDELWDTQNILRNNLYHLNICLQIYIEVYVKNDKYCSIDKNEIEKELKRNFVFFDEIKKKILLDTDIKKSYEDSEREVGKEYIDEQTINLIEFIFKFVE